MVNYMIGSAALALNGDLPPYRKGVVGDIDLMTTDLTTLMPLMESYLKSKNFGFLSDIKTKDGDPIKAHYKINRDGETTSIEITNLQHPSMQTIKRAMPVARYTELNECLGRRLEIKPPIIGELLYRVLPASTHVIETSALWSIKRSHLNYDVNFTKNMRDFAEMPAYPHHKGEIYEAFKKDADTRNAGKKKHIKLNVDNETFFKAYEKHRFYDHDTLHYMIVKTRPTYQYLLKSADSPSFCKDRWDESTNQLKLEAFLEEAFVIGLERFHLTPPFQKDPHQILLYGALKLIRHLSKGYFQDFCIDYFPNLYKGKYDVYSKMFFNNFEKGKEDPLLYKDMKVACESSLPYLVKS